MGFQLWVTIGNAALNTLLLLLLRVPMRWSPYGVMGAAVLTTTQLYVPGKRQILTDPSHDALANLTSSAPEAAEKSVLGGRPRCRAKRAATASARARGGPAAA